MASIEDIVLLLMNYIIELNSKALNEINEKLGEIMSNQENLDQRVQYLGTQVQEVVNAVNDLKEQVAGMNVDFSGLDAAIQPLADIVPDAEPEPEPEP